MLRKCAATFAWIPRQQKHRFGGSVRHALAVFAVAIAATAIADAHKFAEAPRAHDQQWFTAPSLPAPIAFATATSTPDGRVWVIGGFDTDGNALSTVWAFSPQRGRWTAMPSMPTPRGAAQAVATADKIYVIGGTPTEVGQLSVVEVFDLRTGRWSGAPSMPTARFSMGAAIDERGRIHVVGGVSDNATFALTDAVETFDTRTNQWSIGPSLPEPRALLVAGVGRRGQVYAIGGVNQAFDIIGNVDVLARGAVAWSPAAPLPHAVEDMGGASAPDGRIYVVGGKDSFVTNKKTGDLQMLDPETGKWTVLAPMPTPRCNPAVALTQEGYLFAVAGEGQAPPNGVPPSLDTVEVHRTGSIEQRNR